MAFPTHLANLSAREAITDTIYRAVAGYDENDYSLLESACTEDVTFQMAGASMQGLKQVKALNFDHVGQMDTTHFITNVRVNVAGEDAKTASATCNALAQHYPRGEGTSESERRLLVGAKYVLELVKEEASGLWKVKTWELKVVWREGDARVMQP